MKKLISIIGCGILSGAACKIGYMVAEALFPNGLHKFFADYKARKFVMTQIKKK